MLRRPELPRSAVLRYALLYTGAFMASVGLIGWLTLVAVSHTLRQQAGRQVEVEASALLDEFREGGRPDLVAALDGRLANHAVHLRYALTDPDGRISRGDERLAQTNRSDGVRRSSGSRGEVPLAAVRNLGDGGWIVVADDLQGVRDVEAVVQRAFAIALATAAGLGLVTGSLLSRALLRRLDAVTHTAEAVVAGDLARRIPRAGVDDEFDRLAATLNRMLDRIGSLLENLQQVTTDIAHDLRTPLSRLRHELDAASRRPATPSAYREIIARATEETDTALEIFAALLRIAQIEAGSRRTAFRLTDVAEVLRTLTDAYEGAVAETNRFLRSEVSGEAWVQADGDLLTQLFANLIENALQHTPPGTTICVSLVARQDTVVGIVRDNGPGIPEAEREKVFRRFYRLDQSRSSPSPSHGLGLSLVAAIAELHDGSVRLDDDCPGLRVSVELRRSERRMVAVLPERKVEPDQDTKSLRQSVRPAGGLCRPLRALRARIEGFLTTRAES